MPGPTTLIHEMKQSIPTTENTRKLYYPTSATGSSPEADSDPELTGFTETSGLKVTRRRCLEGSPSGAGGGWIIGAAGVTRSETHSAGALSGLTVTVPELLGGLTGETWDLELAGI